MSKDEALRLALDWFKCYQDKSMSRNNAEELADEVIVAIKAALEAKVEPASTGETLFRQSMSEAEKVGVTHLIPPKQEAKDEPVAWMCADESLINKGYARFSHVCMGEWKIPVYTKEKL